MKSGILYLSFSTLAFVVSGYVINIWLGKSLGPEAYGIYGVVITLLTTINLFQTSGLPQATSKFIAAEEDKENEILKSSLVLQIISTLIITLAYYLFAYPIANLLNDISLVPYLRLSSLIFPFYGIFSLYSGYYNGRHHFKKQATINIAYSISKLFAVIGLAYMYHLSGAIGGFIVAPVIALLFGFKTPDKSINHFPYKKLINFSIPLIMFAFFSMIQQSLDLYFVKAHLLSNQLTGFYAANQNIARIPFYALGAISTVLFPVISKSIGEKDVRKTRETVSQAIRFTLIVLLPLSFLFSATSKQIIQLLFSKEYLPGALSLSVLVVSFIFLTMFSIFANILNGAGLPYKSAIISVVGVTVTAIFCYILVPIYGLVGASVATGIGGLISMTIAGYYVYQQFNILIPIKNFLKIIFASLAVYVISSNINFSVYLLPLNYLISGIAYLIILLLLRELTQTDYQQFYSLMPVKLIKKYGKR